MKPDVIWMRPSDSFLITMALDTNPRNPDLRAALVCGMTQDDLDTILVDNPEYAAMRGLDDEWGTLKLNSVSYGGDAARKSRASLLSQWRKGHATQWIQTRLQSEVHVDLSDQAMKRLCNQWIKEDEAKHREARQTMRYLLQSERDQAMQHFATRSMTPEQQTRAVAALDRRIQKKWETVAQGVPFPGTGSPPRARLFS